MELKRLDALILAAVAALSLLPLLFMLPGGAKTEVEVRCHGEVVYRGSLDTDTLLRTPDGKNLIRVENGEAYMQCADCPDESCVEQGRVTAMRPVVCLPNEVVIRLIPEEKEEAFDVISG